VKYTLIPYWFVLLFFILGVFCSSDDTDQVNNKNDNKTISDEFLMTGPPDPAPTLLKRPRIHYPYRGANGKPKRTGVIVQVSVDTNGFVFDAKTISRSDSIFSTLAESLAYKHEFAPPIFDGRKQRVIFKFPIIFDPDSTQL
jgi:hypothetical protein